MTAGRRPSRRRRPGPGALAATLARLADAAQPVTPALATPTPAAGAPAAGAPAAGAPAAGAPATAAAAILALLDPLIRARYPDAAVRITDLQRLADAAAALAPALPTIGSLATRVDAALGSLWDG